MASKRDLKRAINSICSDLFAECVAAALYNSKHDKGNMDSMMSAVLMVHSEYIKRVSHPQPGMPAKEYYGKIIEQFTNEVNDIIDGINNVH